nr:hypothetical protein [Tanacetum cinerariifolium]
VRVLILQNRCSIGWHRAGDDKGFLWRIGQGDWAFDLQDLAKWVVGNF